MTALAIRGAAVGDLEVMGRLGALLVQEHHDFDERRFIAPTPDTPRAYAAYLGTQLANTEAVVLVAEQDVFVWMKSAGVWQDDSLLAGECLQTVARNIDGGVVFLRLRHGGAHDEQEYERYAFHNRKLSAHGLPTILVSHNDR